MTIQFYDDELAYITNGKIKYNSFDFDPSKYKTRAGAAKAFYKAVCKEAESRGQDPELEVHIWSPEQNVARGYCRSWCVSWESGPYEWAIGTSYQLHGEAWYTEPYYSFDLCFAEK